MNDRLRLLVFPLVAAGLTMAASEARGIAMSSLANAASTAAILQDPGPRIGVIDAERLTDESELGKALSEKIRSYQTQTEDRVRALRGEIEQLDNAIQTVSPSSDQARDLRRRRQVKVGEFQTEQQVFSVELQVLLRQSNIELLRATEAATRKVASEKGYSLVLRKSPPIPADFDPTAQTAGEQLERLIARNVTVYVDPSIDVTSLVLTQMNADFEASGRQIPEAPAPSTIPTPPTTPPGDLPDASQTPGQPAGQ